MSLEVRGVTKRVDGETHIHPTDLTLEPGAFNVLLGTTGAGKTTLMQIMAGLERPTAGTVWFGGTDVTGVAVQTRNVSLVHQQFINYPNLTVFENIASPLRVARRPKAEIRDRVERMAALMKLTPMLGRRPAALSGGQQQRCAMARALVKDASLVLLDEPLANLDFKLREELRDELPRLFADRDCVVVYATTEPTEALLLGGTTATLFEGRVAQVGPTGTVYRQPDTLTSAQVFSEPPMNTAAVTKRGETFEMSDGTTWTAPEAARGLPDGAYVFGIRPHHVTPHPTGAHPVALDGLVLLTELSGSDTVVHFRHGEGEAAETWVSQAHGIHALRVGQVARLHMDVAQGLFFDRAGARIAA
ncbi:ABC transporter ATP-binding protein [Roseospira marina]|uniref:ABC transporter ATP-binding protein n=1 Tax=Roseospira marina TaxID=140057 RepID=A0A5M6IAB5_9PROT|nr:ABC transporter ATP-binding protein [Roseospira marina]KAA5605216.1 ABC transporter ATP-binding protein [Roseospira marina]MBB4314671.1 glycerol transport system ATP-binding protein [Roseospira marina]MBB5087660.1 glycerol transport system ATP-binding protein [Roseospira marina]